MGFNGWLSFPRKRESSVKFSWIPDEAAANGYRRKLRYSGMTVMLCGAALSLTACGIKGDLVNPKDIPAYEKQKQQKIHRAEDGDI